MGAARNHEVHRFEKDLVPFTSMRLFRVRFSAVLIVALTLATAGDRVTAATAQEEYAELRWLHRSQLPTEIERYSDAALAWSQNKLHTLHDRGMAFISANPQSPLRWDVLVLLRWGPNHSIQVMRDGTRVVNQSPQERANWNRKYFPMIEELLTAEDAGTSARSEALLQLIEYYSDAVRRNQIDNPKADAVPQVLEWITQLHAIDPENPRLFTLYKRVAQMLNTGDPALCERFLAEKQALHPDNPDVQRYVKSFRRLLRNQAKSANEVWDYLARIDPAYVDTPRYQGKVVLIVELSVAWDDRTMLLEELHQKYHVAGLEIIQLYWFYPDAKAPPLQRDREEVLRHVAGKNWPWPVIVDSTTHYTERFHDYWALPQIPAALVVGRDGRLTREIGGAVEWEERVRLALFESKEKR